MPHYSPGLDAGLNGRTAAGNRIAFFSADPGPTGANEISGTGRPSTTWGAAEDDPNNPGARRRVGSQVVAPISAGTTVWGWGQMSAATGGTLLGAWPLAEGPETFTAAGEIKHTPTLTDQNG